MNLDGILVELEVEFLMVSYDGCPTMGWMRLWGKLSVILVASEVDILAAIAGP